MILSGCDGGDEARLIVEVRTDLAAGEEFARVHLEVGDPGSRPRVSRTRAVVAGEDYVAGVRLAELERVPHGQTEVEVTLVGGAGEAVARRTVLLEIEPGVRLLTVVIARGCVGVMCPGPADDSNETTCSAGECVDPHCVAPGEPGCGEVECTVDSECVARCAGGGSDAPACAEGICLCPAPCTPGAETCNAADDDCDGRVDETFDLAGDPANCGACGDVCAEPTPLCAGGSCASSCPPGRMLCGSSCADTATDVAHCGGCDRACSAPGGTARCEGGGCRIACDAGFGDCNGRDDDGCETTLGTAADCNGCGDICDSRQECVGFDCMCAAGFRDCGGTCAECCGDGDCSGGRVCQSGTCALEDCATHCGRSGLNSACTSPTDSSRFACGTGDVSPGRGCADPDPECCCLPACIPGRLNVTLCVNASFEASHGALHCSPCATPASGTFPGTTRCAPFGETDVDIACETP
jgi:hypothetical protein